jgi:hypothetical protein
MKLKLKISIARTKKYSFIKSKVNQFFENIDVFILEVLQSLYLYFKE